MNILGNDLLTTGFVLSAVGGLVYSLKALPKQVFDKVKKHFLFTAEVFDTDEFFTVLENWLYENHASKYKNIEAGYDILYYRTESGPTPHIESFNKKNKNLQIKQGATLFTVKYKGKRIFFNKSKEKLENASDKRSLFSVSYKVTGYRAKEHILSLFKEITEKYNLTLQDNRVLFYGYGWGNWSIVNRRLVKPISKVIMEKEKRRLLTEDVKQFLGLRKWYETNNIPYKRTYCFYGPPGTGKSTLSFSIAAEMGKNVAIVSLNSLADDSALTRMFMDIPEGCVLLIEDIDSVFVQRENTTSSKISFSGLLNCLDGAMSKEGLVTIITTNHIEKLDSALLRAGRTDLKMKMPLAGPEEISEYFEQFFGRKIHLDDTDPLPMSLVQEICIRNMENPDKAFTELLQSQLKIAV